MNKHLTYAEKLKTPLWQRKRLEVFQRDNFSCLSCGRTEQQLQAAGESLQVHHLRYFQGFEPWEYEMCYLISYCSVCHETEHVIGDRLREIHLQILQENPLYIRPLTQVTNLITEYPPFYNLLKDFLTQCTIDYLRLKEVRKAA